MASDSVEKRFEEYDLHFKNIISLIEIKGPEVLKGHEEELTTLMEEYKNKFSSHEKYTGTKPAYIKLKLQQLR